MKNLFIKTLSIFICYSFCSMQALLPETIATAQLIKYGTVLAATAVAARMVNVSPYLKLEKINIKKRFYPQVGPYDDLDYIFSENTANSSLTRVESKGLLEKAKDSFFDVKNKYFQKKSFVKFGASKSSKEPTQEPINIVNQNYIHAQQARGLFPRINNNYYYQKSDGEQFWKGFAAGTFVSTMSSLFLVLKVKKD